MLTSGRCRRKRCVSAVSHPCMHYITCSIYASWHYLFYSLLSHAAWPRRSHPPTCCASSPSWCAEPAGGDAERGQGHGGNDRTPPPPQPCACCICHSCTSSKMLLRVPSSGPGWGQHVGIRVAAAAAASVIHAAKAWAPCCCRRYTLHSDVAQQGEFMSQQQALAPVHWNDAAALLHVCCLIAQVLALAVWLLCLPMSVTSGTA